MKAPLTIAALVLAGVVSTAAFAQLGPKEPATQPATDIDRVKVGQPAPDFTLEDSDSKAISLSDFRGKSPSSWFSTGATGDPSAWNSSGS